MVQAFEQRQIARTRPKPRLSKTNERAQTSLRRREPVPDASDKRLSHGQECPDAFRESQQGHLSQGQIAKGFQSPNSIIGNSIVDLELK